MCKKLDNLNKTFEQSKGEYRAKKWNNKVVYVSINVKEDNTWKAI